MDLKEELKGLESELAEGLAHVSNPEGMEALRVEFLGRRGRIARIMSRLPDLPPEERAEAGRFANEIKQKCGALFQLKMDAFEREREERRLAAFDCSMPGRSYWEGSLHPVTLITEEICSVFSKLGFDIVQGPEIEVDRFNFEFLNMPPEHPARDMQDTLYIDSQTLLRTHTSPVQIRTMLKRKPPLAVIAPGKVYRRDSDLTHTPMFHQVEGLMVGTDISMGDLRGILSAFVRSVFGPDTRVRFRPSFFPFTEPSAEVDISCAICHGSGRHGDEPCRVCKATGWVEILGSGMVDPAVFEAVGYDDPDLSGFAFGLGVERVAMLKYGVNDLRMFFQNDIRFLSQFGRQANL